MNKTISRNRTSLGHAFFAAPLALAVVSVACSSGSTGSEAAGESSEGLSAGASTIVGLAGKCLDDISDGTSDGNTVDLYTCNGSAAQQWTYTNGTLVGPGGKCLDISGDHQVDNDRVQLWHCNGTSAQQWTFVDGELRSSLGLCLNVKNANPTSGTPLELYDCSAGAASEQWTMKGVVSAPVDAGAPPVVDAGSPSSPGDCSGASAALDGTKDAAHPSGEAPPSCTPSGYKIAYIDDFPGKALASGWTTPSSFQYNSSWVSSSLVTVHDGMMDIGEEYSGKAGDEAVVGWAQLTNNPVALLKYGKFLVRQRADVQTNVAVATLTWPVPANTWPPEIDFAEDDVGDRHWYAFNHYKDSAGKNAQVIEDSGLTSTDWHTWGIEWSPSSIVYTRDGAVWKTETDPEVIPDIQMYLGFVMACFQTPPAGSSHWQMDWVALYSKD